MAALLDAHARLATCRTAHGDIPWTAVDTYARRHDIACFDLLEDAVYGFERVRRAVERMQASEQHTADVNGSSRPH